MKTRFSPKLGGNELPIESVAAYVKRMHATLLPNFPAEVLEEWFHRHWDSVDEYDSIPFERLVFRQEKWTVNQIPKREAYRDPSFFDELSDYSHFPWRLANKHDWLLWYMKEHGTWNSPPILFENTDDHFPKEIHSPWHLLEGHRRVGLLHALASQGLTKDEHPVFICRLK
jgi:hypothetical protein